MWDANKRTVIIVIAGFVPLIIHNEYGPMTDKTVT
jgi:hypothetical protein